MRTTPVLLSIATLAIGFASHSLLAQTPSPHHASPVIQDDNADLLAGAGMGQSRVADDHGYPGPRHTLDLANDLGLTARQRTAIEATQADMKRDAVRQGRAIVAADSRLAALFAENRASEATLQTEVAVIAALRADLRLVHLKAHLKTTDQLSAAQRRQYARLRHPKTPPWAGSSHEIR